MFSASIHDANKASRTSHATKGMMVECKQRTTNMMMGTAIPMHVAFTQLIIVDRPPQSMRWLFLSTRVKWIQIKNQLKKLHGYKFKPVYILTISPVV